MTRILVVDDEPDIVAILSRLLKGIGYEIIPAHNGKDAIEKLGRKKPDLVTLDIMMPEMDGFETLEHIRKISSVPVIMVSVKDDQEDIVKSLHLGANDFMSKPYNKTIFLAKVRSLLKLKQMEDKLKKHSKDVEGEVEEKAREVIIVSEELKAVYEKLNAQHEIQENELNLAKLQLEEDRTKINFIAGLSGISSLTLFLALIILMKTGDFEYLIGLLILGTVAAALHILIAQKKIEEVSKKYIPR